MSKIVPLQISYREAWARGTDTPLRFFVHLLFVIEGVLGVILICGMKFGFDKQILFYIVLALIGLGALALFLVFILVAFFPKNLVFDKSAYLFEKALDYGDESHIIAYKQLANIEATEAPKAIADKQKEGGANE